MVKISQLTEDTNPTVTDSIPTYDLESLSTKRITIQKLVDLFGSTTGWNTILNSVSVSSGYNKGQKEHDLTFSADMSSILSPGYRLKLTRGTTAPTQCTDLESSSSQYASKTTPSNIIFTDDFTCEGWVKLESYGAYEGIVARRNADTEGWSFSINSSGQLEIASLRIASNFRLITTYQSLPLNRWVHVAATMDNSGGIYTTYIDGVSVPNATTTSGTITALVQGTTALVVGARKSAGTDPFDGKIADVRVWDVVRTATQIRDNMNQALTGSETNLVAYYPLNGNFNDGTSNANNLTGQNSAVATSTDNPMNNTEYAIVTKVATSTVTVFTGTDYNIPNMTLSSPYYSGIKVPFGFPAQVDKWRIQSLILSSFSQGSPAALTWYNLASWQLTVPTGAWKLEYTAQLSAAAANGNGPAVFATLGTSSSTATDLAAQRGIQIGVANIACQASVQYDNEVTLTSATPYYILTGLVNGAGNTSFGIVVGQLTADCAYL